MGLRDWWEAKQLARQAKDQNSLVRERAIVKLGEMDSSAALAAVQEALSDSHRDVQIAACESLRRKKDPASVGPLVEALEQKRLDGEVQQAILQTLEAIGPPAVDKLVARLKDKDCQVQAEIAETLGKIKDAKAIPPLSESLKDSDVRVRKESIHALGLIGDPAAIPVLSAELEDNRWLLRAEACEALGRIGSAEAVDLLMKRLKDDKWVVQMSACKALVAIGDARAAPALTELLLDPNEDVRSTAAEMLGKLGDPQAVGPLMALLRDPEASEAAVDALQVLLARAADKISPHDLEGLSQMEDPVRHEYLPDDTPGARSTNIKTVTSKIDCTVLRQAAATALQQR